MSVCWLFINLQQYSAVSQQLNEYAIDLFHIIVSLKHCWQTYTIRSSARNKIVKRKKYN